MTFEGPVDGGAAGGTEPESGSCAFVPDADVLGAFADCGDPVACEASLSSEDAAGTALARQAVAHRHANRLLACSRLQLTTAAGCYSSCHGFDPFSRGQTTSFSHERDEDWPVAEIYFRPCAQSSVAHLSPLYASSPSLLSSRLGTISLPMRICATCARSLRRVSPLTVAAY